MSVPPIRGKLVLPAERVVMIVQEWLRVNGYQPTGGSDWMHEKQGNLGYRVVGLEVGVEMPLRFPHLEQPALPMGTDDPIIEGRFVAGTYPEDGKSISRDRET